MASVKELVDYLFTLAPEEYKMSWDNVGLMCGHNEREVTKVLVALDASLRVAQEAEALGCELVVVHHPLIFTKPSSVSDMTLTGSRLLSYLERGLSVISMHTNLDCAPGGVNDALAQRLGLQNVLVAADGEMKQLVRYGEVAAQPLSQFVPFVKQQLSCEGLRYVDGGKPVRRVAVGGGSCGEFVSEVLSLGCDTFVTADVSYHEFADAKEQHLNLIDAGHFETENPVCTVLTEKLRAAFPQIEVFQSKKHQDCINFA